ncbi:YheT family hydrolase [Tuwongella immobilis]|nr:alpha/beta fold hydrolase [Tuwongella immobilis]
MHFRPLLGLSNGHLQTILASKLHGPRFLKHTIIHRIPLRDGAALAGLDSIPQNWVDGDPIVIIVHGMGGSARSGYVDRTGSRFFRYGVRVLRLDLRGSGLGVAWSKTVYHAGVSNDLADVMAWVSQAAPHSPVVILGSSLGGNITLKYAGECGANPPPNLKLILAVNPPINLLACLDMLENRYKRFYDKHFMRDLVGLAKRHARHHPDLPLPQFPKNVTVREFDALYTAPRNGFASAEEYYHRASAESVIPQITLPTLILTARDDPFIAVAPFDRLVVPSHITVDIRQRGGHLGYLGWDGQGGIRWGERYVVQWAMKRLASVQSASST